jgi:hypothetical protein
MYADHAPRIADAMRSDLEAFRRGVLFAVLSVRQPVRNVPAMLEDVDREGRESAYLLGWKRASYVQLQLEGRALWADLLAIPQDRPADAMARLMSLTGLGLVKAGFVAQLMGWNVACLDSRNAEREGTPRRKWDLDKGRATPRLINRKITAYLAHTEGRAEEYWDAWCEFVAPDHKLTPEEVSALHLAILPEPKGDDECPF